MKTLVAIWILVYPSSQGRIAHIEFYSKEQCEQAIVKVIEIRGFYEKAFCIYKGDPQEE